jgi:hypothetical protein
VGGVGRWDRARGEGLRQSAGRPSRPSRPWQQSLVSLREFNQTCPTCLSESKLVDDEWSRMEPTVSFVVRVVRGRRAVEPGLADLPQPGSVGALGRVDDGEGGTEAGLKGGRGDDGQDSVTTLLHEPARPKSLLDSKDSSDRSRTVGPEPQRPIILVAILVEVPVYLCHRGPHPTSRGPETQRRIIPVILVV